MPNKADFLVVGRLVKILSDLCQECIILDKEVIDGINIFLVKVDMTLKILLEDDEGVHCIDHFEDIPFAKESFSSYVTQLRYGKNRFIERSFYSGAVLGILKIKPKGGKEDED